MTYDFSGKSMLLTGGTGGLGRNLIKYFLDCNLKLIIVTYRSEKEMQSLKSELANAHSVQQQQKSSSSSSTEIEFIQTDITNQGQVKNLISNIFEKYGQIHILVNLVGGYIGGKSIIELEESEWDKMMDINLKSAFLISKNIMPKMIENRYGKLVHISSRTGVKAEGNDSAYAASKAGLVRFVESVSKEVKNYNININCILPTIIDTEHNRKAMPNADFTKWLKPEDLSNVILFLCSDHSKLINGAAIPTYG
ncbi:MAG TPA: SDR family NAD(P)-dependent oxidoreductase, partial [Candidatus Nitrosocosmicus sp.]|nr:SDR family NAD(P)-dependent oxidoreductase [Candidatus Nitrosocosmicus sp.]